MRYIDSHCREEKLTSKGERDTRIGCEVIYFTNIKSSLGFRDFRFIELRYIDNIKRLLEEELLWNIRSSLRRLRLKETSSEKTMESLNGY